MVLDTKLLLKRAFYAMVDTSVRACPLWDSDRQAFVGMLTITDFIRILQQSYQGPAVKEGSHYHNLMFFHRYLEPNNGFHANSN